MGYYDGNTVTAMWNYAQNFAMNDNSFDSSFGPSTPGAVNLISGQTNGATPPNQSGDTIDGSIIGDRSPPATPVLPAIMQLLPGQISATCLMPKALRGASFRGDSISPSSIRMAARDAAARIRLLSPA
jgi:phospholipase C